MELNDFLDLAQEYADLGWAVQGQLRSVNNNEPLEDQSVTALEMVVHFLDMADSTGVEGVATLRKQIAEYVAKNAT